MFENWSKEETEEEIKIEGYFKNLIKLRFFFSLHLLELLPPSSNFVPYFSLWDVHNEKKKKKRRDIIILRMMKI